MSRPRILIAYAVTILALVGMFAVFIWFRNDTTLVAALGAAGTVAAGAFAAFAAIASMRAAAESSASARRSREALVRTARPRVHPSIGRDDGRVLGKVQCGGSRAAVDLTVVWILPDHETITDRTARLEPWRPDLPPEADIAFSVDLKLPETADVAEALSMVWIEYWDESRIGHWQDIWRIGTEPHNQGVFIQTESRLVD